MEKNEAIEKLNYINNEIEKMEKEPFFKMDMLMDLYEIRDIYNDLIKELKNE
jgi:hypothetical protein